MSPADAPDALPEITPLDRAIRDYLMRLDAGEVVSSADLLAAHHELRDDLQAFLDVAAIVQRLAGTQSTLEDTATEYKTVNEPLTTPASSQAGTNRIAAAAELTGPFPMLLGQYRVLRHIGQGAMGAVYVADDVRLGRKVALKVPLGSVVAQSEALDRFMREAQASAKLRHHNICPVYEVNELNGIYYIAMAFIEGKPLSELMNQKRRFSGKQIAVTIRKIAQALEVAHRAGIVHRDLKPANIMVDQDGEPIVMDFGLARQMNSADQVQLTQEGMILGTPAYMSPEQVRSELNCIGPASDVYSLGVILYELLCGRHPFSGPLMTVLMDVANEHKKPPNPSELRPNCDPQLEAICLRMLSKPIRDRYSSMKEVAAALSGYLKSGQTMPEIPVTKVTTPASSDAVSDAIAAVTPNLLDVPISSPDQQPPVSALETQSAVGIRGTSRRSMLAFGSLGALVIAGVIIITITNRNGSQSTFTVPDTSKVDISHKADDPTPQGSSKQVHREPPNEVAKAGWYGWPKEAPKPAIAPFNKEQATKYQKDWAEYLNVPVEYTNSIKMKFRLIPPGKFLMGSSEEEVAEGVSNAGPDVNLQEVAESEAPQHEVVLTQPFYYGLHEVTQKDYSTVMGANPSFFSETGAGKEIVKGLDTSNHPVEDVTCVTAAEFCEKLSLLERLKPFSVRTDRSSAHLEGIGYRLPFEAECEFACRAGTLGRYWAGDTVEDLRQIGWFQKNSADRTHEVGQLKPNPFGLYDVHGNASEWIQDEWDLNYFDQFNNEPALDPIGPKSTGLKRILHCGDWSCTPYQCRASFRYVSSPTTQHAGHVGMRMALSVDAVRQTLKLSGPAAPKPEPKLLNSPLNTSATFAAERRAAEHVLKNGGTVDLDSRWGKPLALVDGSLPNVSFFVREIRLESTEISDPDLIHLQACSRLEVLHLKQSRITDRGLADCLSSWPRLEELDISGSTMAGPGLDLFGCPGLRELHCPERFTNERLVHVVQTCPLLKTVSLSGASGLNVQALTPLRYLSSLTCGGDSLTVEGIKALTAIPSLQRLTCMAPVDDEVATRLCAFGSQLQSLEIVSPTDAAASLTDTGYLALGKSLRLLDFTVRGSAGMPGKTGLLALASMPDLRSISIQCDDAGKALSSPDLSEFRQRHPEITLTVGKVVQPGLLSWPEGTDGGIAAWDLPKDAPSPAIAPFSTEDAKRHQAEWAGYLRQDVEIKNSVGMKFRLVPPGEFVYPYPSRSNPRGKIDPSKRSLARLDKPYYLGVTEVTIQQFAEFVDKSGYTPESDKGEGGAYLSLANEKSSDPNLKITWKKPGPWISKPQDPVTLVSWQDATAYCQWLSSNDGFTYRLPSEMEWYHAFWAGSTAKLGFSEDSGAITELGRFRDSIPPPHEETTSPVHSAGQGKANAYGLSDMLGNVWEFAQTAAYVPQNGNPVFPLEKSGSSVTLGVGWNFRSDELESAWCGANFTISSSVTLGFRVLRQLDDIDQAGMPPRSEALPIMRGNPLSTNAKVSRPRRIDGLRSWSLEPIHREWNVVAIAQHPTRDLVATSGSDSAVSIWTAEGKLKQLLLGHSAAVNSLHFFRQGNRLLSSDSVGELRIWNTTTGGTVYIHTGRECFPVAVAPDEKTIAAYLHDDQISLIDVNSGIRTVRTAVPGCYSLAWSPDSRYLCSTANESSVFIWQVKPWKQIAEVPLDFENHAGYFLDNAHLAWSPDGKTIALNHRHGKKIHLIDGLTFQQIAPLERPSAGGKSPVWSRDSRYLIATCAWGESAVFDLSSRKRLFQLPLSTAFCWSKDESKIYSGTGACFDAATGEQLQNLGWTASPCARNISLSPDGRALSTTEESGRTSVWDAATGKCTAQWTRGSFVVPPFWAPDGSSSVAIIDDAVQFINPISGIVFRKINAHPGGITKAIFSPEGRWLATSGRTDGRLCVYDALNGARKWDLKQQSPADHIAWSPDGMRIATSHNQSREIRIWSFETGQLLKSYGAATSRGSIPDQLFQAVTYLNWSFESAEILVGNYPYNGFKMDLQTGRCQEWGWHYLWGGHASFVSLAPNRESLLLHNGGEFSLYSIDALSQSEFLGQLGAPSSWMPDNRRIVLHTQTLPPFGYDLATRRRLGTLYPVSVPNVWLCIGPTGHYRSGFIDQPGDGTDPKALSAVEDFLVYVAQAEDGSQVTYTPKEFAEKFGWKNDPTKATFLDLSGD